MFTIPKEKLFSGLLVGLLMFLSSCSSTSVSEKKSPQDRKADIYYADGTSQLVNKNYSKALNQLLKANEFRPDDSKIHNNLGMAYYFKGKLAKAEQLLKRAIELDPKNSDARNNLASIYFKNGRYGEAKKEYLFVLKDLVYEHQYRVYYNLGLISNKFNNIHEAEDYFNLSLGDKGDYCPSHFQLGEIAYLKKNYAESYRRFQLSSMGTCVNSPAPHYHQALSLVALKKFKEAKAKLKEVMLKFKDSVYFKEARSRLRLIETREIDKAKTKDQKEQDFYDVPKF